MKLMLKWPGLHYSTSASPEYYPQDIVDFANTTWRVEDLLRGYYPITLSAPPRGDARCRVQTRTAAEFLR